MTTPEENRRVMAWAKESTENYEIYMEERKLWCAILMHPATDSKRVSVSRGRLPLQRITGLAAAVVLLMVIVVGYLVASDGIFSRTQVISVPSGQRVELTLADGTHIWLNAKSRLEYSTLFGYFTRNVSLSGEGYFEVTKSRRKPFIVRTQDYDIKVLGTTFNVCAFEQSRTFETSLIEGSVEVVSRTDSSNSILLQPNQTAVNSADGTLVSRPLVDRDRLRWIEGMICLNNVTFGELIERFSNYFDTEIRLHNPSLYNTRCTGKFRQSDGVEYSLRVLQNLVQFSYTYDNQKNVIEIY